MGYLKKTLLFLSVALGFSAFSEEKKQDVLSFLPADTIVGSYGGKPLKLSDVPDLEAYHLQLIEGLVGFYQKSLEQKVLVEVLNREAKKANLSGPSQFLTQKEESIKLSKEEKSEAQKKYPNIDVALAEKNYLDQKKAKSREVFLKKILEKENFKFDLKSTALEIPVGDQIPVMGNPHAKNVIHLFSDFQCPYCKGAFDSIALLKKSSASTFVLYFHHLPLPFHAQARPAAIAAQCAHLQKKFWEFHDELFQKQSSLGDSFYKEIALKLKLDMSKFEECLKSSEAAESVDASIQTANRFLVRGTPTFIVNGKRKTGSINKEDLN